MRLAGMGRRRRIWVALPVSLVLTAAFAGSASAAIDVNDDASGTGPSGADCVDEDFSTISAAITAATAGETINVCGGTYNEALDVNKANLTLRGAQAGVDARDRTGADESTINLDDGATFGITVNADGLNLDGFTITDHPSTGIRSFEDEGMTLLNNIIKRDRRGNLRRRRRRWHDHIPAQLLRHERHQRNPDVG